MLEIFRTYMTAEVALRKRIEIRLHGIYGSIS